MSFTNLNDKLKNQSTIVCGQEILYLLNWVYKYNRTLVCKFKKILKINMLILFVDKLCIMF